MAGLRGVSGRFPAGFKLGHRNFHDFFSFRGMPGVACTSTPCHDITSGRVGIDGYRWISMDLMDFHDFKDFIKCDLDGHAHPELLRTVFTSETNVSEAFEKFEIKCALFSTLSSRFGIVEITRCDDNQQNAENC